MTILKSKQNHVLYVCMVLFQSFKPIIATGAYFQLITGADSQNSIEDTPPHIHKEFHQCGREQSCTHVIKLPHGYEVIHGSNELGKRKHEAVHIYEKMWLPGKIIACH